MDAHAALEHATVRIFPALGFAGMSSFSQAAIISVQLVKTIVGRREQQVEDELELLYQTGPWSKPSMLRLSKLSQTGEVVTAQAELFDASGVPCLDARNVVRFESSGAALIDNLGTVNGSRRVVELCNGRAEISLRRQGAGSLTVSAEGIEAASLTVQ